MNQIDWVIDTIHHILAQEGNLACVSWVNFEDLYTFTVVSTSKPNRKVLLETNDLVLMSRAGLRQEIEDQLSVEV